MELRQYWNLLRRWIWLVALGGLLAGGVTFVINRKMTPVYQASTTLLVTPGSTQPFDNYSSLIASERLAQTYAQLLQSTPVLEETQRRLEAMAVEDPTNGDPASGFSVSAQPVQDTQLLWVRVAGTDPDLLTTATNVLVQVFIEWQAEVQRARYAESKANLADEMEQVQATIQQIEDRIRVLQEEGSAAASGGGEAAPSAPNELSRLQDQLVQYRNSYSALLSSYSNIGLAEANSGATVTIVSPAVRPTAPVRPRVMNNTLLAAAVGALLAAGVAFLIEYLDDTVKTPEDLQAAGLGTLGIVQRASLDRAVGSADGPKNGSPQLFAISQTRRTSVRLTAEAYRTLRTNLQFSSLDRPLHSLVVTSAVATEGKTTTAANLAIVMAQAGKRVILVDGDLRRPAAHKLFGLPNGAGLTTALVEGPEALNGYLQETEVENLRLLTAGPVPPNPQELLGSQRMQDLLHRLEQDADIVLLDTPPTLVVADANVLAARADGVLMIVNANRTRRAAVQQAVDGLRQVGANLLGGVLNMVDTGRGRSPYYYSSHYYSEYYSDGPGDGRRAKWRGLARWLPVLQRRSVSAQTAESEPGARTED